MHFDVRVSFKYDSYMSAIKKFSSQMDETVLNQLKEISAETNEDLSSLLTEAARDLILKRSSRPAFRSAADEVFTQFDKALAELAK